MSCEFLSQLATGNIPHLGYIPQMAYNTPIGTFPLLPSEFCAFDCCFPYLSQWTHLFTHRKTCEITYSAVRVWSWFHCESYLPKLALLFRNSFLPIPALIIEWTWIWMMASEKLQTFFISMKWNLIKKCERWMYTDAATSFINIYSNANNCNF
jgi:hypothetical protein